MTAREGKLFAITAVVFAVLALLPFADSGV